MTLVTSPRPTDLRELRDAVLDTPGRLAVRGAGTADWAGALEPVDAVLDLSGLSGVITHNPGDMTVSAHAGTPLRELQDLLREHRQHVAFDAARVDEGATLGGLVATGDAGPAALVHGSLRDLVIGVTVVLADGTVARSGGHVIKNVAGYDLAKLFHGSHGTLGALAEVVLRLHPLPQASATLVVDAPLAAAADLAAAVLAQPLEPAALEWISDGSGQLLVRVEGTEDALPDRLARFREVLGGSAELAEGGAAGSTNPNERHSRPAGVDESAARSLGPWFRHADLTRGDSDTSVLRIGVRPSRLAGLVGDLTPVAATVGLGTGVATVALPSDPDVLADAHARVAAVGGTSQLRHRPPGAVLPAWGPPPSAIATLRAIKTELDPEGRFGPGRFSPWM